MRTRIALIATLAGVLLAGGVAMVRSGAEGPRDTSAALPASTIQAVVDGRSVEWWRSADAPSRWTASLPALAAAVRWRDSSAAISWGELSLEGMGEAKHIRVILARVDPRRAALRLAGARADFPPLEARWTIADAPDDALLALNAGQFDVGGAWGWVVRDGRELQGARPAPLAPAVVVDAEGRVAIVAAAHIDSVRRAGRVREAFQSYPALLVGGEVPAPLRAAGRGVDVAHRDARLALGTLPDGRVLVALTRFEGLGGALELLPFGLTTPEMAALMGALGCRDAVLLDGGVSGQLAIHGARGERREWPGLRRVPLGLIATPIAER